MPFGTLAIGLAVLAAQPQAAACDTVPTSAIAQAELNTFSVAMMLVEAGCNVGLEVHRRDYESIQTDLRRWSPVPLNKDVFDREARVPVGDFVCRFNATHEAYVAEARGGLMSIRPRSGRTPYLDSRVLSGTIAARGLTMMLATLVAAMEGREPPRAVAGSFLSPGGVTVDRGNGVNFSISADGKSFLDVLNEVVLQVQPRGWMVVTDGGQAARVERVGFIHRWGTSSGMDVRLP